LSANRAKSPRKNDEAERAPVLVLARPSSETDDLMQTLVGRADLVLLRVTDLNAAALALRDVAVSLILVCPETEAASVSELLDTSERLRPGTPVLVLRPRSGELVPAWRGRGIGVLRCPITPDVLSRTVDVALAMSAASHETARGK
jgi:hypothetical protein